MFRYDASDSNNPINPDFIFNDCCPIFENLFQFPFKIKLRDKFSNKYTYLFYLYSINDAY